MKKVLQLTAILLALIPAISFAQNQKAGWPEMKNFHSLISASFHPAEEGNLAPLKAKADSLFQAARIWQKSAIPANFKPTETKEALKTLVIKCGAASKGVMAKLSDTELKRLITEVHEAFHTIAGECRRTEE